MRLRRSTPYGPGIRRVRRGRGFSYLTADGERVDDEEILERGRTLVIPPAWRKVWVCAYPNGHIQAVGVDVAGRRQYLYHEQWRNERDEEKFDHVLELARRLPELRAQLDEDLAQRGTPLTRVQAIALRLIDRGVFRVGGEEYAEEFGTRGVATLLREQVTVSGEELRFDYLAKGGIRRRVQITDPLATKAVRSLLRADTDSDRLLAYRNGDGYRELRADEVNGRMREIVGFDCSAKDLRTWQGTILAAAEFGGMDPPGSKTGMKRVQAQVMSEVADALGNTAAVARNSYVDPRVVTAFERGKTVSAALRRAAKAKTDDERRDIVDRAVIRLIRKAAQ
ncbi:DNA topoisomerase IB [Aldersonia kunmingensis]|uniref:DNA topoisomerase IB n=1 Tax=Aldersonia kunmingensis TaxID=408066 RepID=UPI000836619A|nr:DNA topoisomerase IB [Aldersonia kunmingensis]